MLDELAERSLMLDGTPISDPADYLVKATVQPSVGQLSVREMIMEAIATHEADHRGDAPRCRIGDYCWRHWDCGSVYSLGTGASKTPLVFKRAAQNGRWTRQLEVSLKQGDR